MDTKKDIEPSGMFELNGAKYAPIKIESREHKPHLSKLMGILSRTSMIYTPYLNCGGSQYNRELPNDTDIIKEYGLIQKKQSKLSKWERDMVVRIFERNYYRL